MTARVDYTAAACLLDELETAVEEFVLASVANRASTNARRDAFGTASQVLDEQRHARRYVLAAALADADPVSVVRREIERFQTIAATERAAIAGSVQEAA